MGRPRKEDNMAQQEEFQDDPKYIVADDFGFFDGYQLWPKGTKIYHLDEPNFALRPLNAAAKKRSTEFFDKIELGELAVEEEAKNPDSKMQGMLAMQRQSNRDKKRLCGMLDDGRTMRTRMADKLEDSPIMQKPMASERTRSAVDPDEEPEIPTSGRPTINGVPA